MTQRSFFNSSPFLQCIVLLLLSFTGIALFLFMASGLIKVLWGINFLTDPTAIQDFADPMIVQVNRVLLLFQHLGMFVVPAIVFAMLLSARWKQFLGFLPTRVGFIIGSVLVMLAALPAINALAWLNQQLPLSESLSSMEDTASELTKAITEVDSLGLLLFNLFVVALLPALGEEMIFRGALMPIIIKWTGRKHMGVWISAALFSAMHMQFYGFLPRMALGALLGYLFLWSRSLWAPILAHFTNNALAVILIFMIQKGRISEAIDDFEPVASDISLLVLSILAIGTLLFFFHKHRNKELLPSLETPVLEEDEDENESFE